MKKLQLRKKTASVQGSYLVELEVLSAEGIDKNVFVKQRSYTEGNIINDEFVAVCTPSQMEDLAVNNPDPTTSYFRTNKIKLISQDPAFLKDVLDNIILELKMLLRDCEILETQVEVQEFELVA